MIAADFTDIFALAIATTDRNLNFFIVIIITRAIIYNMVKKKIEITLPSKKKSSGGVKEPREIKEIKEIKMPAAAERLRVTKETKEVKEAKETKAPKGSDQSDQPEATEEPKAPKRSKEKLTLQNFPAKVREFFMNRKSRRKARKEAEARRHAEDLASLPKEPIKRFFARLHP